MLPTAACADGLISSHATGSPVMQIRPTSSDDDLAGSINLGTNPGGTVMTVNPQGGSADPNLNSSVGNGVMMVNPTGSATPTTASNAGNGVMQLQPGQVAANGSASDNGAAPNGNTNESDIINKQINLDTVWNNTNVTVDNVNGDVNGQASAVANAFQAVTMNNTIVNNSQYASGAAVGSDLNSQITNINGSVNMSNQVACNNADVSTDPAYTVVNSKQQCAVGDPSQATNVFAAQIQNDVNVQGSVAANVYTEDTNAKYNFVNTNQINQSAVNSTTNVQAYNVGGSVNVSSSAVGNTAQVVHY
ncbi:MAG TPA: hypothetical protein VFV07_00915 [Rhizomicrobium sp.]|nr:hypothetical protein [Rhizomicrobium sp.]